VAPSSPGLGKNGDGVPVSRSKETTNQGKEWVAEILAVLMRPQDRAPGVSIAPSTRRGGEQGNAGAQVVLAVPTRRGTR
jgi:hypothetical protein